MINIKLNVHNCKYTLIGEREVLVYCGETASNKMTGRMEAAKDEILYAGAVRYFKMELTWVTA
jgi:hypothetical protein